MHKTMKLAGMPLVLLATACGPTDAVSSDNISENAAIAMMDPEPSTWQVRSTRDPMIDQSTVTAERTFMSGPFTINVAVSCSSEGHPRYEFSTYMDGEAAEIRWRPTPNSPFYRRTMAYELRLNDEPPIEAHAFDDRYNNVFTFNAAFLESSAKNVASADRLILRFPLLQGDATVEIDQQDPAVQRALAPCPDNRPSPTPSPSPTPTTETETPTMSVFKPAEEFEESEGENTTNPSEQ